jgi:hypothetical protein
VLHSQGGRERKILVCAVASPDSTAREEQFDAAGDCEGDVETKEEA